MRLIDEASTATWHGNYNGAWWTWWGGETFRLRETPSGRWSWARRPVGDTLSRLEWHGGYRDRSAAVAAAFGAWERAGNGRIAPAVMVWP